MSAQQLPCGKTKGPLLEKEVPEKELFFKECSSYINEMIDKGYAEEVLTQQLSSGHSNMWYIPHHGVYHPRKKTLRVFFDCAATFKLFFLRARPRARNTAPSSPSY